MFIYWVKETLGKVWENSKKLWKHSPAACVLTAFLALPNFLSWFYRSIKTRYMFWRWICTLPCAIKLLRKHNLWIAQFQWTCNKDILWSYHVIKKEKIDTKKLLVTNPEDLRQTLVIRRCRVLTRRWASSRKLGNSCRPNYSPRHFPFASWHLVHLTESFQLDQLCQSGSVNPLRSSDFLALSIASEA